MKVIAFVLKAKELNKIGASGWIVVRPISAKTTTYRAPVNETVTRVSFHLHRLWLYTSARTERHAPTELVKKCPDRRGQNDRYHPLQRRVVTRRELVCAPRLSLNVGQVRGVDRNSGVLRHLYMASVSTQEISLLKLTGSAKNPKEKWPVGVSSALRLL